ncbi:MAG: DUF368 domain-containing protein [Treponema sp.]|nr:DUF368 domain-containing protein [Treponema sp.]
MEPVKFALIGIVLGATVVLPGISAGTMAVVFNVYDKLIGIITPNVKKILAAWKFWFPLAIGAVAGVFLVSKLVTVLYENYNVPTVWFFIGVIAGSIPLLYNKIRGSSSLAKKLPSFSSMICIVLALAVMITMKILNPGEESALYTEPALPLLGMLVLAGILAAIAMVIPGISGAFFLLVIGMYRTVLQAVSDLNISLLMPFALGVIAGLFAGAAFIRYLLSKAPEKTYGAVLGLVAGSVVLLFPGGFGEGVTIIFWVVSFFAGTALSFFLGGRKVNV